MSTLTPTPVTLEDLINSVSDVNTFNDGIKTQAVSPRTTAVESITVQVKDDPTAPVFASGTADTNTLNHAIDATYDFEALGVEAGDTVIATVSGLSANVVSVSGSDITLDADICPAGTEAFTVKKPAYWTQKFAGGEWKKSNIVSGYDKLVAYTLPVDTNTVNVHAVVYPWVIASIATYPAA